MSLTSVTYLRRRGPVSQEEPIAAPEGLMVDFDVCLSREEDDYSRAPGYGHDVVTRYAARIGNTPCVFERRRWMPAEGYSAEGEEDALVLRFADYQHPPGADDLCAILDGRPAYVACASGGAGNVATFTDARGGMTFSAEQPDLPILVLGRTTTDAIRDLERRIARRTASCGAENAAAIEALRDQRRACFGLA